QFLPQRKNLFVQILLPASEMGLLQMGNLPIDGTQIAADASKSKALRYKRLLEIQRFLPAQVKQRFALAEVAESAPPEGRNLPQELARREERLARLAVLEARA